MASSLNSNSIQVKSTVFDNICHQLLNVYINMFMNTYIYLLKILTQIYGAGKSHLHIDVPFYL